MFTIRRRRLKVRDAGDGPETDRVAVLEDFADEKAIVVLGDPGMGKTTLFRAVAGAKPTTVRAFVANPELVGESPIFLDGLDEYRTLAKGEDVTGKIASALTKLGKPAFRVSCRAADWFGSSDLEVLRTASASGKVVVVEILSLNDFEILAAVQGVVADPVAFLKEAQEAGLASLLGNPHTLELIALAWSGPTKPKNKFEAFDLGISRMLIEAKTLAPDMTNIQDLRRAAGAAASTVLLSNAIGVTSSQSSISDSYVHGSVVPHPNTLDVETALKRRLFSSPEVYRHEFVHRTVAEFLAAEDLALRIRNGLPIDRVLALICGLDGVPTASLRGLFGWLMCRLDAAAESYVGLDPYGVATYGDASVLLPVAQRAVWEGLRALKDPWFLSNEDERGSFRELANPNTSEVLKRLLEDDATSVHLKIAILEALATSKPLAGFDGLLRELICSASDNVWLKSTAIRAFANCISFDRRALNDLDQELETIKSWHAPAVRVTLLEAMKGIGFSAQQVLSVLKQASSVHRERSVSGYYHPLIELVDEAILDEVLDGAASLLGKDDNDIRFELRMLFDAWLGVPS